MTEARRLRIDAVNTGLPGIMWFVILFGALISLVSTFFFRVVDVKLHGIFVGLLAAFIGLIIMMILSLDRPFRGDLGVSSAPYELVYEQVLKQ
jgi:vacuolar-type H+-ATPase subunit I/STV1